MRICEGEYQDQGGLNHVGTDVQSKVYNLNYQATQELALKV